MPIFFNMPTAADGIVNFNLMVSSRVCRFESTPSKFAKTMSPANFIPRRSPPLVSIIFCVIEISPTAVISRANTWDEKQIEANKQLNIFKDVFMLYRKTKEVRIVLSGLVTGAGTMIFYYFIKSIKRQDS